MNVYVVREMSGNSESCKVDAIVTIDSKGQVVLPKDVREKAGIRPGNKLAVIGCRRKGSICCIVMVKAEQLGDSVRSCIGPLLMDAFK